MPAIDIPLEKTREETSTVDYTICQSRICESRVQGIDCGPEASEWLSLALGKPNLRLIRQNEGRQRKGTYDKKYSKYATLKLQAISTLIRNFRYLLQGNIKQNCHFLVRHSIC